MIIRLKMMSKAVIFTHHCERRWGQATLKQGGIWKEPGKTTASVASSRMLLGNTKQKNKNRLLFNDFVSCTEWHC